MSGLLGGDHPGNWHRGHSINGSSMNDRNHITLVTICKLQLAMLQSGNDNSYSMER